MQSGRPHVKFLEMAALNFEKRLFLRVATPVLLPIRKRSFIRKKLVTREECLRMSRTSKADYRSILSRLNLSERWPNFEGTSAQIQLLNNENGVLEFKYVRPGQSFPAYYRTELILQRLSYMSTMGLAAKDKLLALKKDPPVMIVCEKQLDGIDGSNMVYLRGILKESSVQKYIFHPVFPRMNVKKGKLEERLDEVAKQVASTRDAVLHFTMSLPCFSISKDLYQQNSKDVICLHRNSLPSGYDVDANTFKIYPPIFSGLQKLHLRKGDKETTPELCGCGISDILDTRYNTFNGKGLQEDFTEFLLRAYKEEMRYDPPVNFKKKKIQRKHRRFYTYNPLPEYIKL